MTGECTWAWLLQVEMSSLTGEPKPVLMRVDPEDTSSVVHAHNIGFSSSLVITGEGIGVVTRYVHELTCHIMPWAAV